MAAFIVSFSLLAIAGEPQCPTRIASCLYSFADGKFGEANAGEIVDNSMLCNHTNQLKKDLCTASCPLRLTITDPPELRMRVCVQDNVFTPHLPEFHLDLFHPLNNKLVELVAPGVPTEHWNSTRHGCFEEDYADKDFEGKLAVIRRGNCYFAQKLQSAKASGAIAGLMVNNAMTNSVGGQLFSMSGPSNDGFLAGLVPRHHGDLIFEALDAGKKVFGKYSLNCELPEVDEDTYPTDGCPDFGLTGRCGFQEDEKDRICDRCPLDLSFDQPYPYNRSFCLYGNDLLPRSKMNLFQLTQKFTLPMSTEKDELVYLRREGVFGCQESDWRDLSGKIVFMSFPVSGCLPFKAALNAQKMGVRGLIVQTTQYDTWPVRLSGISTFLHIPVHTIAAKEMNAFRIVAEYSTETPTVDNIAYLSSARFSVGPYPPRTIIEDVPVPEQTNNTDSSDSNSTDAPSNSTDQCTDLTFENGGVWSDSHGRDCSWYETYNMCSFYGESFKSVFVANEACCYCGGGSRHGDTDGTPFNVTVTKVNNTDAPSDLGDGDGDMNSTDSPGDATPIPYSWGDGSDEAGAPYDGNSSDSNSTDSPNTPLQCTDLTFDYGGVWRNSLGYNCSWYETYNLCSFYGESYRNVYVANESCCHCGGGAVGNDTATPVPATAVPVTGQCTDLTFNGTVWRNSLGYNCSWYETYNLCAFYGNRFKNAYVANEACCHCGGGAVGNDTATAVPSTAVPVTGQCTDLTFDNDGFWHDSHGRNCSVYEQFNACSVHGENFKNVYVANEACCHCGGGAVGNATATPVPVPATGQCTDLTFNGTAWRNSLGYNCSWYETYNLCAFYGNRFKNAYVANEACCHCGGGAVGNATATPVPSTAVPVTGQCADLTFDNDGAWHDFLGHNCSWYETYNMCSFYGDRFVNVYVANEACCHCGGGAVGNATAAPYNWTDGNATAAPYNWTDGNATAAPYNWTDGNATAAPYNWTDGNATAAPYNWTYGNATAAPYNWTDGNATAAPYNWTDGTAAPSDLGSTNSPVQCTDLTFANGVEWYDRDGPVYSCAWYSVSHRCTRFGHNFKKVYVANEACCHCGGGSRHGDTDSPDDAMPVSFTWAGAPYNVTVTNVNNTDAPSDLGDGDGDMNSTDSPGDATPIPYSWGDGSDEAGAPYDGNSSDSNSTDSPNTPLQCTDLTFDYGGVWRNSLGYNCSWYETYNLCSFYGESYRNVYVANEACCHCGGGAVGNGTATAVPATAVPVTGQCTDLTFNGTAWRNSLGYNCSWYETYNMCSFYGESFKNVYVANEACCHCGGGAVGNDTATAVPATAVPVTGQCTDLTFDNGTAWRNSLGYNCSWYETYNMCSFYGESFKNAYVANEACCHCGGGAVGNATATPVPATAVPVTGQCTDLTFNGTAWRNSLGYNCSWYETYNLCAFYGNRFKNAYVANEACCHCGGGAVGNDTATPVPATAVPVTGQCADLTFDNGTAWRNSLGYNCSWYETYNMCSFYGESFKNAYVANEACCHCGGGAVGNDTATAVPATAVPVTGQCTDLTFDNGTAWRNSLGYNCSWYETYNMCSFYGESFKNAYVANEACCHCGGGAVGNATATPVPATAVPVTGQCTDLTFNGTAWRNSLGYNCSWYETYNLCAFYGNRFKNAYVANEACCHCGGGAVGNATATPVPVPVTGQCTDLTFDNGTAWRNSLGYNCSWYETYNMCSFYGESFKNAYVANEACCHCGGGAVGNATATPVPATAVPVTGQCTDLTFNGTAWRNSLGYNCSWYETYNLCAFYGNRFKNAYVANEACCHCGGGAVGNATATPVPVPVTGQCTDLTFNGTAWRNSLGYNCSWYETYNLCAFYGNRFKNAYVANEACCHCGGGAVGNDTATPVPATAVPVTGQCTDLTFDNDGFWHDSHGRNCSVYEQFNACLYGGDYSRNLYVANEACCHCGGGSRHGDTDSPDDAMPVSFTWAGAPFNVTVTNVNNTDAPSDLGDGDGDMNSTDSPGDLTPIPFGWGDGSDDDTAAPYNWTYGNATAAPYNWTDGNATAAPYNWTYGNATAAPYNWTYGNATAAPYNWTYGNATAAPYNWTDGNATAAPYNWTYGNATAAPYNWTDGNATAAPYNWTDGNATAAPYNWTYGNATAAPYNWTDGNATAAPYNWTDGNATAAPYNWTDGNATAAPYNWTDGNATAAPYNWTYGNATAAPYNWTDGNWTYNPDTAADNGTPPSHVNATLPDAANATSARCDGDAQCQSVGDAAARCTAARVCNCSAGFEALAGAQHPLCLPANANASSLPVQWGFKLYFAGGRYAMLTGLQRDALVGAIGSYVGKDALTVRFESGSIAIVGSVRHSAPFPTAGGLKAAVAATTPAEVFGQTVASSVTSVQKECDLPGGATQTAKVTLASGATRCIVVACGPAFRYVVGADGVGLCAVLPVDGVESDDENHGLVIAVAVLGTVVGLVLLGVAAFFVRRALARKEGSGAECADDKGAPTRPQGAPDIV